MKFSLAIYAGPGGSDSAATALSFARAVLQEGHELQRLFFFNDGVLHAVRGGADEVSGQWQTLIEQHQLDAVVCVNSAEKRGLAIREDQTSGFPLAAGFSVAGLAQLVDAALSCDRLLTFGQ